MHQVLTVFKFTFKEAIRKKAFIISTVIILSLILIACCVPMILNLITGEGEAVPDAVGDVGISAGENATVSPSEYSGKCYIIDAGNLIPSASEALAAAMPWLEMVPGETDKIEEYRALVSNNSDASIVQVVAEGETPQILVTTKDFMTGVNPTEVADVLTTAYIADAFSQMGLDASIVDLAQTQLSYRADIAGKMDISGYVIGIVLTMLMFFAIYYYGYSVAISIATEKTTRVMETLIVSARPSRILVGKCLAMGALGLLQLSGILAFTAACYSLLVPGDFTIMGAPLSLSAFTLQSAILVIVYFLLGYALYAVMYSACGASVSRLEDVNSAMTPVMLITMVSFYLGYVSAIMPTEGIMQKVALLLPFSSPFIVPFKLLNTEVAFGDIGISLALLCAAIVVVTFFSIRIYEASVLHYGKRMKLSQFLKSKP